MLEFEEIEIDRTASRFDYLASQFEETAYNIRQNLDLHDAVPTVQQSNWLEFLVSYSRTLRLYADDARRIAAM